MIYYLAYFWAYLASIIWNLGEIYEVCFEALADGPRPPVSIIYFKLTVSQY